MTETKNFTPLSLWERAVVFFKSALTSESDINKMERHFPQFTSHEKSGTEFLIGVSDQTQIDYFEPMYKTAIERALANAGESGLSVRFVIDTSAPAITLAPLPPPKTENQAQARIENIPIAHPVKTSSMPLNENYTFENFVKGPSNNFAHAIATAVAKDPGGSTNNPFFIWGGTGLGKTHLMQAIGHSVLKNFPGKKVCYITSEEFLNEYINALSNDTMSLFRARYRSIDLLLLDDVQFIAGKQQFQEEFFNTYSSLMTYSKQVVMTCDVPPQKLLGRLEERLISRFQQGIVIEIELPSYETRMAILKFKARSCRHDIPECAFAYIVENIRSSVRAMEGALNLVERFMDANPEIELSPEAVRDLLKNLAEEETVKRKLSIEEIIKTVCSYYEVTYGDIISANRTQPLATARQVAMFLCRKLTGNSLPTIATHFKRNHTTVLHGMSAIQTRIDVEAELKGIVSKITEQLGRQPSEIFE